MPTPLAELPASFAGQELRAYDPTWRERMASWLMAHGAGGTGEQANQPSLARENFVGGVMGSTGLGPTGIGLSDLTPFGIAFGVQEAIRAGDYKGAAINLVPGAVAARSGVRAARRGADAVIDAVTRRRATASSLSPEEGLLYNPPAKPQRPFSADYPGGVNGGKGSRLDRDTEGRPLVAETVVGRRTVGGADEAITPAQLDAGATKIAGVEPESVAESALPPQTVGQISALRGSSGPLFSIHLVDSLPPEARHRVLAHEFGHLIDSVGGKRIGVDHIGDIRAIPQYGIRDDLRQIYHDLNDQTWRRGKPTPRFLQTGPEAFGYKPEERAAEYMAEAIRAYLADPNYIKTVAPETAARIRQYVNSNPRINRYIQFNAAVPAASAAVLGGAGALVAEDEQ
jgi:hypothetical protein